MILLFEVKCICFILLFSQDVVIMFIFMINET